MPISGNFPFLFILQSRKSLQLERRAFGTRAIYHLSAVRALPEADVILTARGPSYVSDSRVDDKPHVVQHFLKESRKAKARKNSRARELAIGKSHAPLSFGRLVTSIHYPSDIQSRNRIAVSNAAARYRRKLYLTFRSHKINRTHEGSVLQQRTRTLFELLEGTSC